MTSLKGTAVRGFIWDYAGKMARRGASFAVGILLARLLSPEEFGLVGMVAVFIAYGEMFTSLGLGSAIVQSKELGGRDLDSAFVLNLGLAFLVTVLLVLSGPMIARFYGEPKLVSILQVLAVGVVIRGMGLVPGALLRRQIRFDVLSKVALAGTVVGGVVGASLALAGKGVWALVCQSITSAVVVTGLYWFFARWRPGFRFSGESVRRLLDFGGPMFAAGLLNGFYSRLDTLIVGKIFNASELGLFSRAKSLNRFIVAFSSDSLSQVSFSVFSTVQEQTARIASMTLRLIELVALIAFGLSGWLFLIAEPLVVVLLTEKWLGAVPLIKLFCMSSWVIPVSACILAPLKAVGHAGRFLKLEIVKVTIGITGLGIGFLFGLEGYILSLAVTGLIVVFLNMWVTGRSIDLKVRRQLFALGPGLLAALVATFFTAAVNTGSGPLWLLASRTVVFVILFLLGGWFLSSEVRGAVSAMFRRIGKSV